MFNVDVAELFALADDKYAVMVVKHDFNPPKGEKMDHQTQENYYRKNWSSLVLWNTDHPANERLTVTKVNEEMGRYLHSFMWLKDDEIGELDSCWNHLVGYTEGEPKVLHWTDGGPWFEGMEDCLYNELWFAERDL